MSSDEPWKPNDATDYLRKLSSNDQLRLTLSNHAKDQMLERDLFTGDVLYVLKNGFVYAEAIEATQPGLWRYAIETRTPNSGNRVVRVIAIPDLQRIWIKVVTVMWADT